MLKHKKFYRSQNKKYAESCKADGKRIEREIEEKEGLLEDIEYPKDLKLFQLVHYKNSLVNVKEYSLQYKDSDKPVFQGLSFDIKKGDRVVLSGKNGSGKTTIIRKILEKCNSNIGVCIIE